MTSMDDVMVEVPAAVLWKRVAAVVETLGGAFILVGMSRRMSTRMA